MMLARNIELDQTLPPNWRVAEKELVRWMKMRGFRIVERGWIER